MKTNKYIAAVIGVLYFIYYSNSFRGYSGLFLLLMYTYSELSCFLDCSSLIFIRIFLLCRVLHFEAIVGCGSSVFSVVDCSKLR